MTFAVAKVKSGTIAAPNARWSPGWFRLTDGVGNLLEGPTGGPTDKAGVVSAWLVPLCWAAPTWYLRLGLVPAAEPLPKPDHRWRLRGVRLPGAYRSSFGQSDSGRVRLTLTHASVAAWVVSGRNRKSRMDAFDFKVRGWKDGGRIILDRVDGESLSERYSRTAVSGPDVVRQNSIIEVPPGGSGAAYLTIPRKPGAKTIDLEFSGYRYRMADFVFKPERAASRP